MRDLKFADMFRFLRGMRPLKPQSKELTETFQGLDDNLARISKLLLLLPNISNTAKVLQLSETYARLNVMHSAANTICRPRRR